MPHHIYTTRAFVVSSRPTGEANRSLSLLTDDLGLVHATAQGVRHEKSKLRYSLQDYDHALVSLVRGRETWRIVGAEEVQETQFTTPAIRLFAARIFSFLEQFIHGEGRVGNLVADLETALAILGEDQSPDTEKALEAILMVRALYYMGYVESKSHLEGVLLVPISDELLKNFGPLQAEVARAIDQAVMGSQL